MVVLGLSELCNFRMFTLDTDAPAAIALLYDAKECCKPDDSILHECYVELYATRICAIIHACCSRPRKYDVVLQVRQVASRSAASRSEVGPVPR